VKNNKESNAILNSRYS